MIIEVYRAGENHPAIYDAYIDREGTLWDMCPAPPADDGLIQVVLEFVSPFPTTEQFEALHFLRKINEGKLYVFYDLR
jgi:hypothetical protein